MLNVPLNSILPTYRF